MQCLDILSAQTENPKLAAAVKQISGDIQGGSTLADALSKHKTIFNSCIVIWLQQVKHLETSMAFLNRLADYQEKAEAYDEK